MNGFVLSTCRATATSTHKGVRSKLRRPEIATARALGRVEVCAANVVARCRRLTIAAAAAEMSTTMSKRESKAATAKKAKKKRAKKHSLERLELKVELEDVAPGDEFDAVVLRDYVGRFGREYVFVDAGIFQYRKKQSSSLTAIQDEHNEAAVSAARIAAADEETEQMDEQDREQDGDSALRKARIDGRLKLPKDVKALQKIPSAGKALRVRATRVQPSSGRLDVKPVFKGWRRRPEDSEFALSRPLESFRVAEAIDGAKVLRFVSAGVLLDVGAFVLDKQGNKLPIPALLFRGELPDDTATKNDLVRKSSVTRILEEGDHLTVYIRRVLGLNRRLRVSMYPQDAASIASESQLRKRAARRKLRRTPVRLLHEGSVLWGKVAAGNRAAKTFGTFIDIGARRNALLHVNDMPKFMWGEVWKDELKPGALVHIRILTVDRDAKKVQVELLATQGRLEEYLVKVAENKSNSKASAFARVSNEDKFYESLPEAVLKSALSFMPAELCARLSELESNATFVATKRAAPSDSQLLSKARPIPLPTQEGELAVEENEEEEEEEDVDDDDGFDESYFEDKYGF